MSNIHLVVAITSRELEGEFEHCIYAQGPCMLFSSLGHGTVLPGLLDLLGLDKTEKSVLLGIARRDVAQRIPRALTEQIGLSSPGRGIALSVPITSVDRQLAKAFLGDNILKEEGDAMNMPYELVVAIADKGASDLVMDAARTAGATGGTVIHAKGMDAAHERKFFGISLADEKEIVLIVVSREDKAAIMKAIVRDAGASSEAHTILLSLPVSTAAGLAPLPEWEETE